MALLCEPLFSYNVFTRDQYSTDPTIPESTGISVLGEVKMNSIILAELARIRHKELLNEAASWREASLAPENKSDNERKSRRLLINVILRCSRLRLFQDIRLRNNEELLPHTK